MAGKSPSFTMKYWNMLAGILMLVLLVASPAISVEAAGGRELLQSPIDPSDCVPIRCGWGCAESVPTTDGGECCIRCNPQPIDPADCVPIRCGWGCVESVPTTDGGECCIRCNPQPPPAAV